MAYKDDDKTMAVIKFAEEFPEGKLKWCDIVEWLNREETWEKYPFSKRLRGIREYQFSRQVTRNGKKQNQECKLRFDEINEMRNEITKTKLPLLITVRPEKFFDLSYSQQIEAIHEAQESYIQMKKSIIANDQIARSNEVNKKRIDALCISVDELSDEIKKTITRTKEQMNQMMKRCNEASVIQIMEKYEIPMDAINIVKIMDELDSKFLKVYDIRDELKAYRNKEENKQMDGGQTATIDDQGQSDEDMYWNIMNASLFS